MSMEKIILPGYPKYAYSEDGNLYSMTKGQWRRLSDNSRVLSIRNDNRVTTITRSKFMYCARHQINPDHIDGRKFLILSNGEVSTPRERNQRNNIICSNRKKKEARARLVSTMKFTQACIDYLDGKLDTLMMLAYDVTPFVQAMLNRFTTNKDFQQIVIDEAKSQFLDALDRGAVTNPRDWIYARCRGIAIEKKQKIKRLKDYDEYNITTNF